MEVLEILSTNLSLIKPTDTVSVAVEFLNSQGLVDLPISDKGKLYGYARVVQLAAENPDSTISSVIPFNPFSLYVFSNQHVYEAVPVINSADLACIAVVNENKEIIGVVEHKNILREVANSLTYKGSGVILQLEISMRDYALSQISRIAEEEGAKVLGIMIKHLDNDLLQINLKINTTISKSVVAAMRRFGFNLTAVFMAEDQNENDKSYDSVLKFFDL